MGSEKRQRQRENRMRAIAEAERSKKRSTTGRKVFRVVLIVAAVLIALWLWSTFSGGDDDESSDEATVATQAPPITVFETDEPSDVTAAPEPGTESDADAAAAEPEETGSDEAGADDAGLAMPDCPAADGSDGPRNQFDAPPLICIDAETMYAAEFNTNMGDFTMVLDPTLDLDSVNNFVVLARWGAFDGTLFHRVISDFVIQGGDVQLDFGRGGPGYQFTGAFPPEDWYRIGSVAMANRGNPATNGSQFFVITGSDGAGLPPLYSPLGHVIDGMDTVMEIDGVATGAGDVPSSEVVVNSVSVTEASPEQVTAYSDARG